MKRLAIVSLVLLSACSRSTPPTAKLDPASVPSVATGMTTGRSLFCAFGGVGVVPDPMPPEFESEFVSVVVELDHPGPAVSGVVVQNVELADDAEKSSTTMRRVIETVKLDVTKSPPGRNESGSWAFFLNPTGDAFDGSLQNGRTRLRIRASLKIPFAGYPAHVRVTIGGLAKPLVVEGEVWGSWPT